MILQKDNTILESYMKYFFKYLELLRKENSDVEEPPFCTDIKRIHSTKVSIPVCVDVLFEVVFEMNNGNYIHYTHYKGDVNWKKILKCILRDLDVHEETEEFVDSIIVSSGNSEESETKAHIGGDNVARAMRIYFLKDYDGDQRLKNIKTKIENHEKITYFDILDLIFIPFLNTSRNVEEIIKEICSLVSKLTQINNEQIEMLFFGLWMTTEIFIENSETLEKVRNMSILNGKSINEKLREMKYELGKAERKKLLDEIKTLENEGKTLEEIMRHLKC